MVVRSPGVLFADGSRVFDGEQKTVFADVWHFSDIGHEILADHLAEELVPLLPPPSDGGPDA
jgi:hypothetical protein